MPLPVREKRESGAARRRGIVAGSDAMMRFISAAWVLQFGVLLVGAFLLLVAPLGLPVVFNGCALAPAAVERVFPPPAAALADPRHKPSACDFVERGVDRSQGGACCLVVADREAQLVAMWARMLVPLVLALALLSLQAAMRTDPRLRRTMAWIFTCVFGALSYQLYSHRDADARAPARMVVVIAAAGFLACNALCVAWPVARSHRALSGSANTRPSPLWVLWLVQALVFGGLAWVLFRYDVSHWLLVTPPREVYHPVLATVREIAPPLYLAIALVSFLVKGSSREWVWLGYVRSFVALYVAWILLFLFVWSVELRSTTALVLVPLAALLAGNLRFAQNRVWSAEEVGEGPDGWVMLNLVAGPVLMLRTLLTRRRAMYARGVAASGTFTLMDDPSRPQHEFFDELVDPDDASRTRSEGNQRRVLVRFSTAAGHDDAGLEVRGAAVRISGRTESIDLFLATGSHAAAENVVEYALLVVARALGRRALALLAEVSPRIREGGIAGLRRAPSCYANLRYHAQVVRFWVDTAGVRHLVRYRLVPAAPDHEESGLPTERDVFSERERARTEQRAPDYLRRKLKRRLQGGATVALCLQAQFHELSSADGVHWYNPGVDWYGGQGQHPWLPVGQILLVDALSDEETETLEFSPANAPPSLGTPVARGMFDFRSIADSQRRVIPRIQQLRRWMVGQLGAPSFEESPRK